MSTDIQFNKVRCRKLKIDLKGINDFECSNKKFTEYLKVHAYNDQIEQIGQTWIFVYEEKIIGFITIAMAHMKKNEHKDLQINGFGNIPALLIGHLATHRNYERKGVGSFMVSWAIRKAIEYSESVGCRLVMLNPERGVIDFYKKQEFTHVPHVDAEFDNMFFDIKQSC